MIIVHFFEKYPRSAMVVFTLIIEIICSYSVYSLRCFTLAIYRETLSVSTIRASSIY